MLLFSVFKQMRVKAINAGAAVIWVFTLSPSQTLLHYLLSFRKLEIMLFGGFIFLPPSIKRIRRSFNSKSQMLGCFVPLPMLIRPRENPAAREYPSLSKVLSLDGYIPIYIRVISLIILLQLPRCRRPIPIIAAV